MVGAGQNPFDVAGIGSVHDGNLVGNLGVTERISVNRRPTAVLQNGSKLTGHFLPGGCYSLGLHGSVPEYNESRTQQQQKIQELHTLTVMAAAAARETGSSTLLALKCASLAATSASLGVDPQRLGKTFNNVNQSRICSAAPRSDNRGDGRCGNNSSDAEEQTGNGSAEVHSCLA